MKDQKTHAGVSCRILEVVTYVIKKVIIKTSSTPFTIRNMKESESFLFLISFIERKAANPINKIAKIGITFNNTIIFPPFRLK